MSKTVADVVVEVLVEAGARRCYGIPGDTLNFVTDAMRRNDQMRWIHVRHEEAGGFAASADALLTGELALCAGSCGPGSLHFINGLCEAVRNRVPVLLIASQLPRESLGSDFPQELDFKAIYSSLAVFCEEVRTPEQARHMTVMAAQAALNKRGLAVLILPVDISSAKAPDVPPYAVHHPAVLARPDDATLHEIAQLVNTGNKVTLYAGAGCEHARDEVLALAAKLKAPMAHTSRAKDFLAYDNPYNVGMTGVFGNSGGMDAILGSDVLVLLGCDFAWQQFYPAKAKIIQIDVDPTHLGRRTPVDIAAAGDVKTSLQALLPLVEEKADRGFLDDHLKSSQAALAKLDERAVPGDVIHPQYMVRLISQYAQPDAVVTADGGTSMVWVLRHLQSNGRNRTVLSLRHGTMANAMSEALGAQAAFPGRQVIAVCGDGSFSMLMGDILTTVQENLPIKMIITNNHKLGFVDLEQKVEGLLDIYTDLKNPDFGRVAEAAGLWGRQVTEASQLESAIQQWLAVPGPALLDVHTYSDELVMPPKYTVKQAAGMALYMTKGVLSGREHDVASVIKSTLSTLF